MQHAAPKSDLHSWRDLTDLFRQFSGRASECVLYDNGYRSWKYTYAELSTAALRFGNELSRYGIRKGERLIIWSENRPEWMVAFWACVVEGIVVVPIDYRQSLEFLRHVQSVVQARLILVGEEVSVTGTGLPPVWNLADCDWHGTKVELPTPAIKSTDVVEIVFTSGATGTPRGVPITHQNILADLVSVEAIITRYRCWFRPLFPLRFLGLIPLSHMFGQAVILFILPLIPAETVFMRGYSPHEILHQIRIRRVSVLVAVPKVLEVLHAQLTREFPNDSRACSLKVLWPLRWWHHRRLHAELGLKFWAFIIGGAPLAKEFEEFWSGLGFALIQGYGLTETAPIVAFNNPFDTRIGTVGKPIAGVQVKIAPDREVLVRGPNVATGYVNAPDETAQAFSGGWFHTGDLGYLDPGGDLVIQGRKKEVIVTAEGLKVFPDDVEAVLDRIQGVREAAVVGRNRVHAVLVIDPGVKAEEIVRTANAQLEDYQRIRDVSLWTDGALPRTEGTSKLKRHEIQTWVDTGHTPEIVSPPTSITDVLKKYAPGRDIKPETTLDELGLSSLDRAQLMIDLEQHLDVTIDESLLTSAHTVSDLSELSSPSAAEDFPRWSRSWPAQILRNVSLCLLWLPLARIFASVHIEGVEHLSNVRGPVIFTPNHQSHLDTPLILSALPAHYRYHVAAAMWKEYFDAHFSPRNYPRYKSVFSTLLYWLIALFFNGFPVPQTEVGARQSLRYAGDLVSDGWSVLFFPEGERTEAGEIHPFQPGIGLLAKHLGVPVIPIRLRGVEKVLHRHAYWPHRGPVEITFGPPLERWKGLDYAAVTKRIEQAVRTL